MRRKDQSVECVFDPTITELLFELDDLYQGWGDELVITSGSEAETRHGKNSLHYALPARAVDIRSWDNKRHNRGTVPVPQDQGDAIKYILAIMCTRQAIPTDWFEVYVEHHHIHIEFQPKRIEFDRPLESVA